MQNLQETNFCTIATDNFIAPWEIQADKKFGNAIVLKLVGEKRNFDTFCCMLKPEREFKLLWNENCNSWLTISVPNGPFERSQQECITTKAYKENPSYLEQNGNEGRRLNIDRDKKNELFHAISCNSETHQVLDIEEIRSRLDLIS